MKSFDVLNRDLCIHRSYFLEASAGTGKTFSIENIVTRLVVEATENQFPLTLDSILVVTFTREATNDLKKRIRGNLEKSLCSLKAWRSDPKMVPEGAFDYLVKIMDAGEESVLNSCRCLERALSRFEDAQIFTIHGFCLRMLSEYALESGFGFDASVVERGVSQAKKGELIRDFFRSGLLEDNYGIRQLAIVSKNGCEDLISTISKIIDKGRKIQPIPSFKESFEEFKKAFHELSLKYNPTPEKILEDFHQIAKCYNKLHSKQKVIHEAKLKEGRHFAQLFAKNELEERDFDILLDKELLPLLIPANLAKKIKPPSQQSLHYPGFFDEVSRQLLPSILEASHPDKITARMAAECMQMLERNKLAGGVGYADDILKQMHDSLSNPQFLSKVQNRYSAAIIDEFQDTDPIQWDIFSRCFLNQSVENRYCYLVGDPKQSIYGFRRADIYTYLKAAQQMGEESRASLRTNYRSQPHLIEALNTLFCRGKGTPWMPLPRIKAFLDVEEVDANPMRHPRVFQDGKGSIHFFIGSASPDEGEAKLSFSDMEKTRLFPYIANEISILNKVEGLPFSSMAVLIKDRYQAKNLADYLKKIGIPSVTYQNRNLSESAALDALEELLQAVILPSDRSLLRKALGGKIIGHTHDDVAALAQESYESEIINQFYHLQNILKNGSFAQFFEEMMHIVRFDRENTIAEKILMRMDGEEFYNELMQLAGLLMEEEVQNAHTPETLLTFLQELKIAEPEDDDNLKLVQEEAQQSVQIMTMHKSKGLEFEVVFALGLVNTTSKKESLIPSHEDDAILVVSEVDSADDQRYREELDAEKMRQLYVVMTRAKERLYVPVAIDLKKETVDAGAGSPIQLFLAKQLEAAEEESLNLEAVAGLLEKWKTQSSISYEVINSQQTCRPNELKEGQEQLVEPVSFMIPGKQQKIHSFTSLSYLLKKNEKNEEAVQVLSEEKNAHSLPKGKEIGTLIHLLLQQTPLPLLLSAKNACELVPLIERELARALLLDWKEVVAEMIFNAFNTPLTANDSSFPLNDINPRKVIREMEFLFASKGPMRCEEITVEDGMVSGSIDFVFAHQNRYFFLDWKTNWLGPAGKDYSQENLRHSMKKHAYFLQAEIYTKALKRYLKVFEDRPFEEYFGGAFYLFMRGVDPLCSSQQGIIYLPPKEKIL